MSDTQRADTHASHAQRPNESDVQYQNRLNMAAALIERKHQVIQVAQAYDAHLNAADAGGSRNRWAWSATAAHKQATAATEAQFGKSMETSEGITHWHRTAGGPTTISDQ